ncbi:MULTISPECIES: hypothetical protein [unclassified Agarivorans]|uniref:hypothetical protein n=1 Tax=unclassified Agarivorans TaxID=2636026 RepID=UPI003D7CC189
MADVAVLSGDIVGSSDLPADIFAELIGCLNQSLSLLCERYDARYEMFRGDAFQLVVNQPGCAIDCALTIRLALKSFGSKRQGFDARIGIGIGQIDPLDEYVSRSSGQAFVLSGRGLDSLKRQYLAIFADNPQFLRGIDLLTKFVDLQIQELTVKQAHALATYWQLSEPSHAALAKCLNSSRVNATKLLNQSQYLLLDEYRQLFRQLTEEFFNGTLTIDAH